MKSLIELLTPYQKMYSESMVKLNWYIDNEYFKRSQIKPFGKLKRLHFIGDWNKKWIDEKNDLFSYRKGMGFIYCGSAFTD